MTLSEQIKELPLEFLAVCKKHGFENRCCVYAGFPLENILSGDFVVGCGCSEFTSIKNIRWRDPEQEEKHERERDIMSDAVWDLSENLIEKGLGIRQGYSMNIGDEITITLHRDKEISER